MPGFSMSKIWKKNGTDVAVFLFAVSDKILTDSQQKLNWVKALGSKSGFVTVSAGEDH